jgi:hypothetical protein
LQIPLKEGIGGEREGEFTDNFDVLKVYYTPYYLLCMLPLKMQLQEELAIFYVFKV